MRITEMESDNLADSAEEFGKLVASDADWIIRNKEDLYQYWNETGDERLKLLSKDGIDSFAESLVFANNGVAGGSINPLISELGLKTIISLFNRFGASSRLALEVQEEKCEGGNCRFSFWDFCFDQTCLHVKEPFP